MKNNLKISLIALSILLTACGSDGIENSVPNTNLPTISDGKEDGNNVPPSIDYSKLPSYEGSSNKELKDRFTNKSEQLINLTFDDYGYSDYYQGYDDYDKVMDDYKYREQHFSTERISYNINNDDIKITLEKSPLNMLRYKPQHGSTIDINYANAYMNVEQKYGSFNRETSDFDVAEGIYEYLKNGKYTGNNLEIKKIIDANKNLELSYLLCSNNISTCQDYSQDYSSDYMPDNFQEIIDARLINYEKNHEIIEISLDEFEDLNNKALIGKGSANNKDYEIILAGVKNGLQYMDFGYYKYHDNNNYNYDTTRDWASQIYWEDTGKVIEKDSIKDTLEFKGTAVAWNPDSKTISTGDVKYTFNPTGQYDKLHVDFDDLENFGTLDILRGFKDKSLDYAKLITSNGTYNYLTRDGMSPLETTRFYGENGIANEVGGKFYLGENNAPYIEGVFGAKRK